MALVVDHYLQTTFMTKSMNCSNHEAAWLMLHIIQQPEMDAYGADHYTKMQRFQPGMKYVGTNSNTD
jgi:hypothetical protein